MNGNQIEEKIIDGFGQTEIRTWICGKLLGKGGFAKCYEFINEKTKKVFAAKVIEKSSIQKQRQKKKLIQEIKIHKSLVHKNIVKFEHVFEDDNNVYIMLEICSNQTLNELLKRRKRITEFETKIYTLQILSSLRYLHRNKVIHRDLKLGNLFLAENMDTKLGDFGLAAKLLKDDEKRYTICGTPNYIAPEILIHKGHSFGVDLWSLGSPPFETKHIKQTYDRIRNQPLKFPDNHSLSDEAIDLITKLLKKNQYERIDIQTVMNHDFFKHDFNLPEHLPLSTLVCPPSANYLKKYTTNIQSSKLISVNSVKLTNLQQSFNKLNQQFIQEHSNLNHISSTQNQSYQEEFVSIKKYLDYSQKYGVGYILENGDMGVMFNDQTTLLHMRGKDFLIYIKKQKQKNNLKQFEYLKYSIQKYPKVLKKKYTLFHYITNELTGAETKFNLKQVDKNEEIFIEDQNLKNSIIFISSFTQSKYCDLLKTNQKVLFAFFRNTAELRFDYKNELLIYIDTQGNKFLHPIQTAHQGSDQTLKKLIKRVERVVQKIVSKKQIN